MSTAKSSSCTAAAGTGWYALYTRYQHEKSVARILQGNGFEVFLPLQTATHRWKDRFKKLVMPLFPSYVFLRSGVEQQCSILATPGVCWFVETAGRPAEIPLNEIDTIRRIVEQRLCVEPHPFLKSGDYVRVRSGVLEGVEGILIRKKGRGDRLVISVELLQRAVAIDLDALSVERIFRRPIGIPEPVSVNLQPMRSGSDSVSTFALLRMQRKQC